MGCLQLPLGPVEMIRHRIFQHATRYDPWNSIARAIHGDDEMSAWMRGRVVDLTLQRHYGHVGVALFRGTDNGDHECDG
jgi:hypothetical protein